MRTSELQANGWKIWKSIRERLHEERIIFDCGLAVVEVQLCGDSNKM